MNKMNLFIYFSISFLLLVASIPYEDVVAQQEPAVQEMEYVVVKGDTLGKIAKKFGVSLNDLYKANGLTGDLIIPGMKLIIPGISKAPEYSKPSSISPEKQPVSPEKPVVLPEKPSVSPNVVEFKWAFVTRIDPDGRNQVVNIAKDALREDFRASVSEADKMGIYVEPGENTYVYLYLLDSRKNLELIFPTSMNKDTLESEFTPRKGTYIPGKYEWFTFDENRGTETFFLIASKKRVTRLEGLTKNYLDADESDKELAKQKLLDEITGVKKDFAFKTTLERPLSYGGIIRGLEIDIARLAVEVEAENFYSKTIRVRHE
ncbi:MAG: LysM peptidoglycan-binding domain-containing protein [Thermodesulfobacteriota bacterium]